MKKINKLKSCLIAATIFIMVAMNSCAELSFGDSFLDQAPEQTGVDVDLVFSDYETAMQVLTSAYMGLSYGIPLSETSQFAGDLVEGLSDLSFCSKGYGGGNYYYTGQYNASTESYYSKYLFNRSDTWTAVRNAWLFIENVDNIPSSSMKDEDKEQAKAEAMVIIASLYADLFRHFGGVPILRGSVDVADDFIYPRSTVEQTVNFIVNDLIDEAVPYLPWSVDSSDHGRMTSAYALGLKFRVLLHAASPIFNSDTPYLAGEASEQYLSWYGDYDAQRWNTARNAGYEFLEKLSQNGVYTLEQTGLTTSAGYQAAFLKAYFTRASSEVLLSVRKNYTNTYWSGFYDAQNLRAESQQPTVNYANMFPMADGTDFAEHFNLSDPYDWSSFNEGNEPFENRDPRFYQTILVDGGLYMSRTYESWVGGVDRISAGYGTGLSLYKFIQDYSSATSLGAVDSWPSLRLPEIYLSYAEALNETSEAPTDEMINYIDIVRSRVGLPSLGDADNFTTETLREAILRERACEFGFEEVRLFDLIRWKRSDILSQKCYGVDKYREGLSEPYTYRYEIYDVTKKNTFTQTIWEEKYYLSAFPHSEMVKDYGLVQNPGW